MRMILQSDVDKLEADAHSIKTFEQLEAIIGQLDTLVEFSGGYTAEVTRSNCEVSIRAARALLDQIAGIQCVVREKIMRMQERVLSLRN